MAHMINTEIEFQGRRYIVLGLHTRWEMFHCQEVGRNFTTFISFDEVR